MDGSNAPTSGETKLNMPANPALVVAACVHIACDFGRHLHLHDEVAALLRACAAELEADAAGAAHRTLQ